jgi:hypothetical protein
MRKNEADNQIKIDEKRMILIDFNLIISLIFYMRIEPELKRADEMLSAHLHTRVKNNLFLQ